MFQLTLIEMLLFTLIVRGVAVLQLPRLQEGDPGDPARPGRAAAAWMPRRLFLAAVHWYALAPTWRARPGSSFMHALIAWGFIFYFLVNGLDVLKGYTGWDVPGAAGDIYRLLADLFARRCC